MSNNRRRKNANHKRKGAPQKGSGSGGGDASIVSSSDASIINSALSLLRWAQGNSKVQVKEREVPVEISGAGNGKPVLILYDMKIDTRRSRRGGAMEDEMYAKDAMLQKFITRGLTVLKVGSNDKDESAYHLVTRGFRKFFGLDEQDEDEAMEKELKDDGENEAQLTEEESDDERQLQLLMSVLPEDTTSAVSTSKENGEACHMSAITIGTDRYWIVGSKNVHLLVRNASDLKYYPTQQFQFARVMAEALLNPPEGVDLEGWRNYLITKQVTANFEFLQKANQHVEPFEFDGCRMMFLTFTSNTLDFKVPICEDPSRAILVGKQFGWEHAHVEVSPVSNLVAMLRKTRDMYRKEGSVIYFVDSKGVVVDMKKVKAIWYVLVRCIREKVRAIASQKVPDVKRTQQQIRKTLKQRQTWLKYPDTVRTKWTAIGEQCIQWVGDLREQGNITRDGMDQFPELWLKFLHEKNLDDHVYPVVSS